MLKQISHFQISDMLRLSGKFSLLLLLILQVNICSQAQLPFFQQVAGRDDLKGAIPSVVFQDNNGFLWVGSNNGLFVYDGFTFRDVPFSDTALLATVSSIASDASGNIWVGYRNGKIAKGSEAGIELFQPSEGLPAVPVTAILFDNKGVLWIATYGEGVYFYINERIYNINTDDGLNDNYIYTLAQGTEGVWAGTDAGIAVIAAEVDGKIIKSYSTPEGLPDIIVQKIIPAADGGMWIGMQSDGICYFDPRKQIFQIPEKAIDWMHGPVNDIVEFADVLWIATESNGIVEVPLTGNRMSDVFSLSDVGGNRINRMLRDFEGNIWLINSGSLVWSSGPGLKYMRQSGDFVFGNIHALHVENDNSFWVGNDRGLFLHSGNRNDNNPKQFLPPQSKGGPGITSLHHDPAGNMWVGTFGNGLFRLENGSKALNRISDETGQLNDNILGISATGDEIWFATLGGVARCIYNAGTNNRFTFNHFSSDEGPGNNFIYTAFADSKGRMWFGTDGKGVAMFHHDRFTTFSPEEGKTPRVVYSVTEDNDGNLWFGSANEGVFRYNGKEFASFNLNSGLRNLNITSVISAGQNQVVVVHNQGIDVINSRTGQVSYPGIRAGITGLNPDLNAVATDAGGSVWIGTQDGIIRYNPEYMNVMAMPLTSVRRVSVYLSDEPAVPGEVFPHNRNNISFEYAGIWFNNPEKVSFRIKLEGNDPDWIYTGDRIYTYSSLRPGKYTFRVQSTVNSDYTYANEASFSFVIKSPFYTQWWFILLAIAILSGIIYLVFKTRLNRIRREQQLLSEKAESQFQLLKSQVNPHFLFNNFSTLMAIIEEDKDTAIEYVGKLSAFFRNVLEYRDKDLIPLSEELEIVDNYLFLQRKRYGDNLRVEKRVDSKSLSSMIPPLTLQLILENAVKHNIVSLAKPLNINIRTEADRLIVENTLQIRKTSEPSTGMGLANIRSRYEIFSGKEIVIEQTEDLYRISLPLIYNNSLKS
jgi:ligand-binding sensor domain-containing protein